MNTRKPEKMEVSSAKSLGLDEILIGKSFIYILKAREVQALNLGEMQCLLESI